jgi:hypothetical protein
MTAPDPATVRAERQHPGATRAQLHRRVEVLVRELHAKTIQLRHQGAVIASLRPDPQGRDVTAVAGRNLVRSNEGLLAQLRNANARIEELSTNLSVAQDRIAAMLADADRLTNTEAAVRDALQRYRRAHPGCSVRGASSAHPSDLRCALCIHTDAVLAPQLPASQG